VLGAVTQRHQLANTSDRPAWRTLSEWTGEFRQRLCRFPEKRRQRARRWPKLKGARKPDRVASQAHRTCRLANATVPQTR